MSYIIKRIGTQPIAIIRMHGVYTGRQAEAMNRILDGLFEGETRIIWRIVDTTDFRFPLSAVSESLSYEFTHARWTVLDFRVKTVLVSNMDYSYLAVRMMDRLMGVTVPLFATLKEALDYVQAQVGDHKVPDRS